MGDTLATMAQQTENSWITRLVSVKPAEIKALLVSGLYFYLVLCAYYIIRPIRDEMVIANGVQNIQWLMLLTMGVLLLIAPLFGWLTARYKTRQFLSIITLLFVVCLLLFFFGFNVGERSAMTTRAFFVWVNVFNMFIVSLFWSFINDVFSQLQARRLFAAIAAGGTAGALTGPLITAGLVQSIGLAYLLLISAAVLSCTLICIGWLSRWRNVEFDPQHSGQIHQLKNKKLGGSIWGGLTLIIRSPYLGGICAFIVLYAISITFVQIRQAELIEAAYTDPQLRTKLFSQIDFAVNSLALLLQLFITSKLITWIGYRNTLLLIPAGITLGFALMAAAPLLGVMIGLEVFRRAGDYAIMKPTREMLFSVVSREEKYKAKNFIDTAVLRSGNTGSALLYAGLRSTGIAAAGVAGISLLLGMLWCTVAFWLGNQFSRKSAEKMSSNR